MVWNGLCQASLLVLLIYIVATCYSELMGASAIQMARREEAESVYKKYCNQTTHAMATAHEFADCAGAKRLLKYSSLISDTARLFATNISFVVTKKLEWLAWTSLTKASLIFLVFALVYGFMVARMNARMLAQWHVHELTCDIESCKKIQ